MNKSNTHFLVFKDVEQSIRKSIQKIFEKYLKNIRIGIQNFFVNNTNDLPSENE